MPLMVAMQMGQFMLQRLVTSTNTMLGLWLAPHLSQCRAQATRSLGTYCHRSRLVCQAEASELTIDSVWPQVGQSLRIQVWPSWAKKSAGTRARHLLHRPRF